MGNMMTDLSTIWQAMGSGDSWELSQAVRLQGFWLVGLVLTIVGGLVFFGLYQISFVEKHLEKTLMVYSYLIIAAIIFVEVIRRFVFKEQVPWSTTVPGYLFLIMTWVGCAYNVRKRTHLAFMEFRTNMPRRAQLACLALDFFLWFVFSWIVVVTASRVTMNSAANFQILPGTDNVLTWWFLITVPLTFMMLVLEKVQE